MPNKTAARVAELRSHGVNVQYANPADTYGHPCERLSGTTVTNYAYDGDMPFVIIDATADSTDAYGGDHMDVANFRALEREFGSAVVRVGYTGTDKLGFFVHSVSDALINVACGLIDYPIYDESEWSEVEQEAIDESWSWLSSDLYRDMPEALQDLYFEIGEEAVRDGFWTLLSDSDYYPECSGGEVRWDYDVAGKILTTSIRNIKRASIGRPALTV